MGHIDPTKDVFAQFRDNNRPGPIHMLNLVRLREWAAYPDGRKATGAEAYAAYGRESGPVFERLGGRIEHRELDARRTAVEHQHQIGIGRHHDGLSVRCSRRRRRARCR